MVPLETIIKAPDIAVYLTINAISIPSGGELCWLLLYGHIFNFKSHSYILYNIKMGYYQNIKLIYVVDDHTKTSDQNIWPLGNRVDCY